MIYFLYGIGFLTYFTFFQKRLTADLGYSAETAGNLFLVVGVAGLVGGFFWGTISDRIGRRRTIAITLALGAAAALLFAWAPSLAALGISAVLLGSTGVVIPGLVGAACGDRFGAVLASASLGFVTILVGVGQSLGPYLGGLLGRCLRLPRPGIPVVGRGVCVGLPGGTRSARNENGARCRFGSAPRYQRGPRRLTYTSGMSPRLMSAGVVSRAVKVFTLPPAFSSRS